MINSWINTSYKFLIVTEITLTQSQSQIQTQIHPNSLKFLQTFLQLFPSNLDSSCRFSIPIINLCTIEHLLKKKLWQIVKNHHCWNLAPFMAFWDFFEFKHNWAEALISFIFSCINQHLFWTLEPWSKLIKNCIITKVRTRSIQFLQLLYGFCRSWNVEYYAT